MKELELRSAIDNVIKTLPTNKTKILESKEFSQLQKLFQKLPKEIFVIRKVNCWVSNQSDIRGFTFSEEHAKSLCDVFTTYEKISLENSISCIEDDLMKNWIYIK